MKKQTNNTVSINNDKMKVLGLQELAEVAGGRMAEAWSTDSIDCGTVGSNEWSTLSRGCRDDVLR
ncbi:hypothetical protein [Pleionea litopenaei]|uniref:Uncharacterized protein n=1 Tax=Pleionea litopenaei TaxID=3070815 RepID=A0AA51X5T5_9GAMM|nr:hypothetical protein [Pleionea sp. HL-JVS1]WMS86051.1 hypothetical protein Q9312_12565 [Pleionea sp. HL-JVS1]